MRTGLHTGSFRVAENPVAGVPALGAYAAWCERHRVEHPTGNRRFSIEPRTYRRITMLKRSGDSFAAIGRAVGLSSGGAQDAYLRLPADLR